MKLHPKPKDESAVTHCGDLPEFAGFAENLKKLLRGVSCQIDPMRMSCINTDHHQHIFSLTANSFIADVGIERNVTIPFIERPLNLPQWFSSRMPTK